MLYSSWAVHMGSQVKDVADGDVAGAGEARAERRDLLFLEGVVAYDCTELQKVIRRWPVQASLRSVAVVMRTTAGCHTWSMIAPAFLHCVEDTPRASHLSRIVFAPYGR